MTDEELIKCVLNGNQNACRFLVAKYQNLVNHIVRRIVLQDAGAEDICQDVFLKVFSRLHSFRGDAKLSTWIATIAYNTSITYLKRKKVIKETYMDHSGWSALQGIFSTESATSYESAETRKIILESVETLPVHYRTILTLFYLEEFSYHEIEKITGMPEGTVKNYLFRARFLLKCKLEKIMEYEEANIYAG
jgi:RNA polymerase sigma factor (sigma-70 family)